MTKIDGDLPLEERARQAHAARSHARREARDAMSDRDSAEKLDRMKPYETFEQTLERKKEQKGLTGDDASEDIIGTAVFKRPGATILLVIDPYEGINLQASNLASNEIFKAIAIDLASRRDA